jgi:hypothetical protein
VSKKGIATDRTTSNFHTHIISSGTASWLGGRSLKLNVCIRMMMARASPSSQEASGGEKKRTISPRSFLFRRRFFQSSFSSSALEDARSQWSLRSR